MNKKEDRCYNDCKIVNELKAMCLKKEQHNLELLSKIEELKEEIIRLNKTDSNEEIKKNENKNKPKKKPPKVIGI